MNSYRCKLACAWCLIFVSSTTENAFADWKYTKWGMTPGQVVAASGGTVAQDAGRPGDKMEGYDVGAVGQYSSGNYVFRAAFYFKQGGLSLVLLNLTQSGFTSCMNLKHDLEGVYGKPYDGTNSFIATSSTWQDKSGGNFLAITTIGTDATATCNLQYGPLKSESAKGL